MYVFDVFRVLKRFITTLQSLTHVFRLLQEPQQQSCFCALIFFFLRNAARAASEIARIIV
jgi:hypothetical protein